MHRSSLLGKGRIGLEIHITGMSEPGVQRGARTPHILAYVNPIKGGGREIMPTTLLFTPRFSDLPAALD
jgi:hypothetical protein